MNEPKTVKVGSSQTGDDSVTYAGSNQRTVGGGWEEPRDQTSRVSTDQPTPSPGQSQSSPASWSEPGGGAQTMIMGGAQAGPSFAWVVITSGAGENPLLGRPLSLKAHEATTLGRVPGNDIVIADTACSSHHARIRQEPGDEGKPVFVIYDLASSNGLYAGTRENYKEEQSRVYRHVLHDGDYLLIGETTLVFKQV